MPNKDNLIPQAHILTVEEASKGGKNSAKVRADKKTYRKLAEDILSLDIKEKSLLKELRSFGIEDQSIKALTLLGMIKAAAGGNHHAFDRLLELSGEKNETPPEDAFEKGKKTLADMINNPSENRSISEFEEK